MKQLWLINLIILYVSTAFHLILISFAFSLQLYEINDDPKRKEFLDDLFMFMKDRGKKLLITQTFSFDQFSRSRQNQNV